MEEKGATGEAPEDIWQWARSCREERLFNGGDEIVRLVIDGVDVRGVITHRSGGDIDVEILRPYRNLSEGWHIPYFARHFLSYETPYGDYRARDILQDLYSLGRFLERNMEGLKEKLAVARQETEAVRLKLAKAKEEKVAFRRRRREGRSDQEKAYDVVYDEKELHRVMGRRKQLEQQMRRILCAFFSDNFPGGVGIGTRDDVLDIIEGRKALNSDLGRCRGESENPSSP